MSRISPATVLLGFFAILCGLLGAFLVTRPKPQVTAPVARTAAKPMTVPVSSAELPSGRRITMGDIALLQLSREEVQARGITGGFMVSTQHIIGRVLEKPLAAGQPFRTEDLYPEGVGPGIGEKLTAGHRAVTVAVGNNDAVLGFATADSWVDVIFRSDGIDSNAAPRRSGYATQYGSQRSRRTAQVEHPEITTTLLQKVRVLAINRNTLSTAADRVTDDDMVSVTLEVLPDQAEKLRIVEGRGQLSLALRSPEDTETQEQPATHRTLDDLLGISPNRVREIEVYEHTRLKVRSFEHQTANGWTSKGETRRVSDASGSLTIPSNDDSNTKTTMQRVVERTSQTGTDQR